MPALSFQKRFAGPVRLGLIDRNAPGAKTQTIRQIWKRPIKPSDDLYLYTGMRTKQCEKLGQGICHDVSRLIITEEDIRFLDFISFWLHFTADNIAVLDGFHDWLEMRDWFKKQYGLPFSGVLIEW